MKKIITLIVSVLIFFGVSEAQDQPKSEDCKITFKEYLGQVEKEAKNLKDLNSELDNSRSQLEEELGLLETEKKYQYFYAEDEDTKFEVPSIIFIFCFLIIIIIMFFWVRAKLGDYNLKKALAEIKLVDSISTDAKGIQTNSKTEVQIESSSRLLAFLSGLVALTLSITLIVLSIYIYLNSGVMPDFGNLVNVVLALGIGVVPYSINKVAGAIERR